MWRRDILFFGLICTGVVGIAAALYPPAVPSRAAHFDAGAFESTDFRDSVTRVNEAFHTQWAAHGLKPAARASDFVIARRLSLALTGSIPSLQEIRQLEAHEERERVQWWLAGIFDDRRFGDYVAERFTRAYVGTEDGPFIVYRRRRFVSWLSDELMKNRPYDHIVRDLIASNGLWTDKPGTNFITVTASEANKNQPSPDRLAARTARAFLGLRIDCAECHNAFFEKWKKTDYEGLAAFFGQVRIGFTGAHDEPDRDFQVEDRKTGEKYTVEPRVPFAPELLPETGDRRSRLAGWITHPQNPYFARETVNRVWALLFGRPLMEHVDNIYVDENSEEDRARRPAALDILADDLVAHNFDLRRLIEVIAASEPFQIDSCSNEFDITEEHEANWAVFPLMRLRPEQVVGSIEQAASLKTINADSNIIVQLTTSSGIKEFVKRYGDTGEDEFNVRTETIPQRLLLLNGDLVSDKTKQNLFNAATRIGWMAPDDRAAVRLAYLSVLTREPDSHRLQFFADWLKGKTGDARSKVMEDIYAVLINSEEFLCNH